eukprot:TRINITY_DN5051_c0_g1_i1.p1 TRINITY_DN5051_c0_g1~~TRINITY_DN5051_c0_g1_i1.p1  ORF type:complete len:602 (-),score=148.21 TRINITY_DN5051_c0_g1_i1:37-1842(-)
MQRPLMFNERFYPYLELSELPRLPIPSLNESLEKYLRTVKQLLTNEEFRQTREAVEEFRRVDGPELYKMLTEFSKLAHTSWLEGWWDAMYLEYRDPLPINMNPFFALEDNPKVTSQTTRAANLIFSSLKFYQRIVSNRIEPDKDRGKPLCMTQYGRLFSTTRIPRQNRDELLSFPDSGHIVVLCRGHFFRLDVLDASQQNGTLSPAAIEEHLKNIVHQSKSLPPVHRLGVLTTDERNVWAAARAQLSSDSLNQDSLRIIDTALFIVCLDESSPNSLDAFSQALLHGDGRNRWFDKSIQLIVCANGKSGINMEHSGIDGHTVLRYAAEISSQKVETSASSTLKSSVKKLDWKLSSQTIDAIRAADTKFQQFVKTTTTKVLQFTNYGKDFIVSHKISPDGCVQMAYQLAYFKLYKSFGSTYESAQTRQFYHGRTECIRSTTPEAALFVRTFSSATATPEEKVSALRTAITQHIKIATDCTNGQGIDRLLTGLYWMAKYRQQSLGGHIYKIPALYTNKAYGLMKTDMMSTSNCGNAALSLFGFGPVVPKGLGLGYIIKNESINVVITSFIGEEKRYAQALEESLMDIKIVLEQTAKGSTVKAKL